MLRRQTVSCDENKDEKRAEEQGQAGFIGASQGKGEARDGIASAETLQGTEVLLGRLGAVERFANERASERESGGAISPRRQPPAAAAAAAA